LGVRLVESIHPSGERRCHSLDGGGIQDFYFEKIRVFKAGQRFEYISME
jgi:hypothetical protein